MLVFTIPVKSENIAKSWSKTCKLLERTLRSICNQTSDKFRVIVICHEKPRIDFQHPNIDYIEVDFPHPQGDRHSKVMDRVRKELVGCISARQYSPCHIMKVDADDCVSRHLAKFVNENPQSNGWFVDRGYTYIQGGQSIYLKKQDFYKWCGTSNILRCDLFDINILGIKEIPDADSDCLAHYISHHEVKETMSARGTPIQPLPFWGAVYSLGHGENSNPVNIDPYSTEGLISYERPILKRLNDIFLFWRPLTKRKCEEFGVYALDGNQLTSEIPLFDICSGIFEVIAKGVEPTLKSTIRRVKENK